ncbi:Clp protease ClpP [Sphingobacterium spiritivorum]|uniref:Clp protease ClpP n=1 Tax=Sphingobacterium spiritivorum TaxID=258 RepID=UPI003DA5D408
MSKKIIKNWYEINNAADMPEVMIYGFIGPYEEVDYVSFVTEIRNLAIIHKSIRVRVHSGGGSVIDGLPMYDSLVSLFPTREIIVEGLAASMAGVLVQAGTTRKINKHGQIMIHQVKGGTYGNAEDLRTYATLVDERQERIKEIFVQATGQPAETVESWFNRTTDWWINAQQALSLGLVDEIIDEGLQAPVPENKLVDERSVYDILSNSLKNQNQNTDTMNELQKKILALLVSRGVVNLNNATDDQLIAAVTAELQKLENKITGFENSIAQEKTKRANTLVENAVKDGKITEEEQADWKDLANSNFELAEKQLAKIQVAPKNVTVSVGLTNSGKSNAAAADDRANWTYQDYAQKDPTALANMQTEDPEKFKALVAGVRNELVNKGAIKN